MSTEKVCGTCKHGYPDVIEGEDIILWCKRYPPMITVDNGELHQVPGPQMEYRDTCGEWQLEVISSQKLQGL